jgi:hypothetical protein
MEYRARVCLAILVVVLSAGGATCWPRHAGIESPPPIAFPTSPTLQQLVTTVNANSQPIRTLQADGATLSIQGLPPLRAEVALERPRRFRMRAELLQFTGTELDLGSNDELFWLWVKRNPQPATYFARHDQFARSPMRRMLPIEPEWMGEAFGLVYLDPQAFYEGPFPEGDERVWIRARGQGQSGDLTKVTVIHSKYGWVLEHHLYDANGSLLAKVESSQHRYYPLEGVSLPRRINVQLAPGQPTEIAFHLDVFGYRINQLQGEPSRLWELPQLEGYPLVDLADPRLQPLNGFLPTAPASQPPRGNDLSYRRRYRGYAAPEEPANVLR